MSTPDRINAVLNNSTAAEITTKLSEVQTLLPFLTDLTVDERKSLPKLGDKSRAFVDRCLELARQDDSFLPRKFKVEDFGTDLALYTALEPLRQRLATLLELVEDTQMLAGSEAYLDALDVYDAAKRAGLGAGLDQLLDRVSRRFAKRRSEKNPEADK
jgi:hypothetical protein